MQKITVTKPYLPPIEDYFKYVREIFDCKILTGQAVSGPKGQLLEKRLSEFLKVDNFQIVTNGTIALQLALKALNIDEGEIITTPFTYIATTSSILWERCTPVFVDIEPNNFTIDVTKIEAKITQKTKAIMPVHVFGYACNVEQIQKIADKYNLKVIYDAAHAFGSIYNGKSLTSFGDVSTLSFQATKVFHTGEGGACICKNKKVHQKLDLAKHFGLNGVEHICLGINGKQEEFNAALGLAILDHIDEIFNVRKHIIERYDSLLSSKVQRPKEQKGLQYNYSYYPVIFEDEGELIEVFSRLEKKNVFPRRYFYPSLNTISYLHQEGSCPISESISKRIACLPLYVGLQDSEIEMICKEILKVHNVNGL